MDLAGSSGHSALGINVPINYTAAYGTFALRCLIGFGGAQQRRFPGALPLRWRQTTVF